MFQITKRATNDDLFTVVCLAGWWVSSLYPLFLDQAATPASATLATSQAERKKIILSGSESQAERRSYVFDKLKHNLKNERDL